MASARMRGGVLELEAPAWPADGSAGSKVWANVGSELPEVPAPGRRQHIPSSRGVTATRRGFSLDSPGSLLAAVSAHPSRAAGHPAAFGLVAQLVRAHA